MTSISNLSLANAFFASGAVKAGRVAIPGHGREAGRAEPVTPVNAVIKDQSPIRGRHLKLVGEEAATRQQGRPVENHRPGQAAPNTGLPLSGSTAFTVQLLSQNSHPIPNRALAGYGQDLAQHKFSAQLGSDTYRRAGAEPDILSEKPTFLSLAI